MKTTNAKKYHYVYRITNLITGMHYYGSRSSKSVPKEDLGKKYFSSSKNAEFIKDQKEHPSNYKYKLIKIFETCREDANNLESKLHIKFDVRKHPKFINLSNQLPNGFSTHGRVNVLDIRDGINKSVSMDDYNTFDYYVSVAKNRVSVIDTRTGQTKSVSSEDFKKYDFYINYMKNKVAVLDTRSHAGKLVSREDFEKYDYYVAFNKGYVTVTDIRDGSFKNVTVDDFHKSDYYETASKNTVVVIDKRSGIRKRVKREDYLKYNYYESVTKNIVHVLDIRDGKSKCVTKEEFDKYDYYESITKGRCTVIDTRDNTTKFVSIDDYNRYDYYVNSNSKQIIIYDNDNNIKFKTFGNFRSICKDNNLPYGPLMDSYKNNSKPIYQQLNNRTISQLKNNNSFQFVGWYAMMVK